MRKSVMSQRDASRGDVLASVAAVIHGENHKILLVWEGDTPYHEGWVLPGGYVKPEETLEQAVSREVREETGLEVTVTGLIGVYDDFITENKDWPVHHVIIGYTAEIIGGGLTVTRESMEYAWMDAEEALGSARIPDVFKRTIGDFKKRRGSRLVSRLRWPRYGR